MSKLCTKKDFMEKLRFYLSFCFSDTERAGILADYEEWFRNESLGGLGEKEICAALEEPRSIAGKLLAEAGGSFRRSFLFHNTVLRILALTAVSLLAAFFFLWICGKNGRNYFYFAIGLHFVYWLVGMLLFKKADTPRDRFWRAPHLAAACTALLILLLERFLLPELTHPQSGKICSFAAKILLFFVLAAILYFAVKAVPQSGPKGFLILFHLSGILTLLLFLFNQLHMLYPTPSEIFQLVWGSAGIYGEVLILGAIFYFNRIYTKG